MQPRFAALWAGSFLVAVFGLAGCGGPSDDDVVVFAAASLSDAFGEMEQSFEAANPGIDVRLNFAGSSALREQILEGAPADLYASANEKNMQVLVDRGEVLGSPEVFAANELQIAVPARNEADVTGLDDFENESLLIGLCAEGVPCGDFARQALSCAGIVPAIDTNEPDVRSLISRIAADELDAAIVYSTDVRNAGAEVIGIDLAETANVTAFYPIARLRGSANPDGADAFVRFVLSANGQAILEAHGFQPER